MEESLKCEFAAAAAIHVGIQLNEEENQSNPLMPLLNRYKRRPATNERNGECEERYILHFAVASAKVENGLHSKTLYVSDEGGEHAEKMLIRDYKDRLHTIRSLYISYSPCSSCVVAIINAFFTRPKEHRPTIGFLWFHGNPEKCSHIHTKNNLRLLKTLEFSLFIMERDVFMQYVRQEVIRKQLTQSLTMNIKEFDDRQRTMKNELEAYVANNIDDHDERQYPCDCCRQCSTLFAVATFTNEEKHEETCAFRLLTKLEHNSADRERVEAITFTYFPPEMLSLRLIQVFYINNCKPVIRFFAFKQKNNNWTPKEYTEIVTMLGMLFKFQIERCSSPWKVYKRTHIESNINCNSHRDARLTEGTIGNMQLKFYVHNLYLLQEALRDRDRVHVNITQSVQLEASNAHEHADIQCQRLKYVLNILSPAPSDQKIEKCLKKWQK